jgi:hypothetical protein
LNDGADVEIEGAARGWPHGLLLSLFRWLCNYQRGPGAAFLLPSTEYQDLALAARARHDPKDPRPWVAIGPIAPASPFLRLFNRDRLAKKFAALG